MVSSRPNLGESLSLRTDLSRLGQPFGMARNPGRSLLHMLMLETLDIVKVRLQASGGNALSVAGNIWRREGPLAFYKVSLLHLSSLRTYPSNCFLGHNTTVTWSWRLCKSMRLSKALADHQDRLVSNLAHFTFSESYWKNETGIYKVMMREHCRLASFTWQEALQA